jgi:hypothetical protein
VSFYEFARNTLDADFGHPKNGTSTCIPRHDEAPRDEQDRLYVALTNEQCSWPEVAAFLDHPDVEEVTRAEWNSVTQQP